jgi:hypothetical protein
MTENSNSATDSNTNPPAEANANPPATPEPSTPATPEPTPPANPSAEPNRASNREVIAAVESLPEKIVNSLREAFTPPTPPANSAPSSNPPAETKTAETPGKSSGTIGERFNKFWWGR